MKFTSGLLFVAAISLCMSSVLGFTGRVNAGNEALNVRAAPNTRSPVIGLLGRDAQFDVDCQVGGESAQGYSGTSSIWYHVPARGGYVSAAWVSGAQPVRGCGGDAGPAKVHTVNSETLNVRSSPSSHSSFIGSFGPGAVLDIDCQAGGETISGPSGTTNLWYHVPSKGGYVSGAFVSTNGRSYPGCSAPAPNSNDCSAGLPNPRSCSQAVAWAEAHLTNSYNAEYRGLCDHFVGLAYGRSASTFDTALIHWQTTPERFRHYDRNPPVGALCFFKTSAMGHACLSTGGGNIISTDINGPGTLGRTSISGIESKWGAPYLGWTNPYFHNA